MEFMNEYLSSDNRVKSIFVVIKNITISFTTSYRAKSILLYKEEKENSTEIFKKKRTLTIQLHRRRNEKLHSGNCNAENYLPRMQSIVKCVDVRLKQLEFLSDNVNKCVLYLIQEIQLKLPASFINQEILKLTLRGNYEDIYRNVCTQINVLTFLDISI